MIDVAVELATVQTWSPSMTALSSLVVLNLVPSIVIRSLLTAEPGVTLVTVGVAHVEKVKLKWTLFFVVIGLRQSTSFVCAEVLDCKLWTALKP